MTGAVTVLFALPAVRSTMPGAPPLGAIMDFAVYFWCIIISVSHILAISGTFRNISRQIFIRKMNSKKKNDRPQRIHLKGTSMFFNLILSHLMKYDISRLQYFILFQLSHVNPTDDSQSNRFYLSAHVFFTSSHLSSSYSSILLST